MPIIEVEHLTKEYRLGQLQSLRTTALNQIRRLTGQPLERRALFKALDDVSFTIDEGEVVGIIGHNGAGKSTLLKLLANITSPSSGLVRVHGRIAPLIEVGAGFVPDLTGRENVYLNGSILGLSRKAIDRKFAEIVEFAEMAEFIDTPVKRYSSGMQVKLAFAVATSIDSEILIVDEVLAVGDLAFQRKCFDRMEDLIKRQGRTVLIVSHNIRQIARMCNRAFILEQGRKAADGDVATICESFYERSNRRVVEQKTKNIDPGRALLSSGEAKLIDIEITDSHKTPTDTVLTGTDCTIKCTIDIEAPLENIEVVFGFHTTDFVYISSMDDPSLRGRLNFPVGRFVIECHIPQLPLARGVYAIRIGMFDKLLTKILYGETLKVFSVLESAERPDSPVLASLVHIHTEWTYAQQQRDLGDMTSRV